MGYGFENVGAILNYPVSVLCIRNYMNVARHQSVILIRQRAKRKKPATLI